MKKLPDVSESEWKVMKVLWAKSPQGAYDISEELSKTERWHPNTVKTLLSRLLKKKAVSAIKYKNLFLYRPLISEDDCVRAESESFLQRVFGGSVKPLLMHFAKREQLSAEDLEELRNIVKGKKK